MMILSQIYGMLLPNKKTTVHTVVFAAMAFTNRQTRLYGITSGRFNGHMVLKAYQRICRLYQAGKWFFKTIKGLAFSATQVARDGATK